ncbi:hypothetical protein Hanom_Chr08g00752291 [Helianthus anomalus]
MPLTSGNVMSSVEGGPSLSDLISATRVLLFDSHIGVSVASEKEMHATSVAGESTSARDATINDIGGSSSGFVDDGAYLGDDLYLPTIYWDPNVEDKRYQPKWKIAESSKLIFPQVVHHWVERGYPLAESAFGEGLNNENLMNATIVDAVSQPRREKRLVSEKNKAKDDLKRVTANLAEERILWAHDIAEKDRVLAHAKSVQEELERKAVIKAQKVKEQYQGLTVELKASNAKV